MGEDYVFENGTSTGQMFLKMGPQRGQIVALRNLCLFLDISKLRIENIFFFKTVLIV